jgi:serine/threonine protein kinase
MKRGETKTQKFKNGVKSVIENQRLMQPKKMQLKDFLVLSNAQGDIRPTKLNTFEEGLCSVFNTLSKEMIGDGRSGHVCSVHLQGQNFALKTSKCSKYKTVQDYIQENCVISSRMFFCEGEKDNMMAEYLIGKLCGDFLSINFLKMFQFEVCPLSEPEKAMDHILMEEASYTFDYFQYLMLESDFSEKDKEKKLDRILFQIFHALACFQNENVQIEHNDLHEKNIMVTEMNPEIAFRGKKLCQYEFLEYRIENESYYFPVKDMELIVKIGDFGLANKYSTPRILNSVPYRGFFRWADLQTVFANEYDFFTPFLSEMENLFNEVRDETTIFDLLAPANLRKFFPLVEKPNSEKTLLVGSASLRGNPWTE